MVLYCKFAMSDGTRDIKLLALIDSDASLSFMSASVSKHLGWARKLSNTPIALELAMG